MYIFLCVLDFPAGHTVKFLVGFSNKGSKEFIIDTMDAAFRYPQDYSFYIQNVCTVVQHAIRLLCSQSSLEVLVQSTNMTV